MTVFTALLLSLPLAFTMNAGPIARYPIGSTFPRPPFSQAGDACRAAFPTALGTVRSYRAHGAGTTDEFFLNFKCFDDARDVVEGPGVWVNQPGDTYYQIPCNLPSKVKLIPFIKSDTRQWDHEGKCEDPDEDDDASEDSIDTLFELETSEEDGTHKDGYNGSDVESEECTQYLVVDTMMKAVNRHYRGSTYKLADFRMIGWVTDLYQKQWLNPTKQITWKEYGYGYSRQPYHRNAAVMRFDDIRDHHSYRFCSTKYSWQLVAIHAALFFKLPHGLKPGGPGMANLNVDAWHYVHTDGSLRQMPEHLAKALVDEPDTSPAEVVPEV